MVTYHVMKRTTWSPIVGQFFDTMIVASSDKEWAEQPIKIWVLETVLSHLKVIPQFALRIPTARDFRVIRARKWASTRTQRKKFPSA